MKFTILLRASIASVILFSFSNHFFAQDEELVFEEVIVTAEKRDESLQTV